MKLGRRPLMLGTAAAMAAACKRSRDPVVPEVWDEAPVPELAEALGRLAPPWPAPARATLESGLLTYWLRDDDASWAHVRLFVPDHDHPERGGAPFDAIVTRLVVHALADAVRRRLGRVRASVRYERGAGRLELVLSGPADALPRLAGALATSLRGNTDPRSLDTALSRARARVARDGEGRTALDVATACVVGDLLGLRLDTQRVDASRAAAANPERMREAWSRMLDPRRCTLVVHAPGNPEAMPELLAGFAAWTADARIATLGTSLARLRWAPQPAAAPKHLMTSDSAPLRVATEPVRGGAKLVLGRAIRTDTVQARATARLAQRVLAETMDARLAVCGPLAVFTINTPVTDRSVETRARGLADQLAAAGATRVPSQRLFTAAQLWLGARVVQASLDGEDWTALWSESMDLADTEADIPRALALDAAAMLSVEPAAVTRWIHEQLDPRSGETGWAWAVSGATPEMRRAMSRLGETTQVPPTG